MTWCNAVLLFSACRSSWKPGEHEHNLTLKVVMTLSLPSSAFVAHNLPCHSSATFVLLLVNIIKSLPGFCLASSLLSLLQTVVVLLLKKTVVEKFHQVVWIIMYVLWLNSFIWYCIDAWKRMEQKRVMRQMYSLKYPNHGFDLLPFSGDCCCFSFSYSPTVQLECLVLHLQKVRGGGLKLELKVKPPLTHCLPTFYNHL